MSVARRKEDRFRTLKEVYEGSKGNTLRHLPSAMVGQALGLSEPELGSAIRYLVQEGLLKYYGPKSVQITHDGLKEYEDAMDSPEEPTQYFPPANTIINIHGNVANSSIQQAGANSHQTATISTNDIRSFVEVLKSKIDDLRLGETQKGELKADIQTVEAQLAKTTPSRSIIMETLLSVKTILEGVASNVIAAGLLAMLPPLLA